MYPIEGNQNTWQTILALERLQRETEAGKIAVVLDNARFHHAKALTGLHEPGQLLERITPIHLPPYAPDHNPVEHVRNTARNNTANIQHETPEESSTRSPPTSPAAPSTTTSSTSHSAKPETILFHDGHTLSEPDPEAGDDQGCLTIQAGTCLKEVFASRADEGAEGSGDDWAALTRVLIDERAPELADRVELDPDAQELFVFSADTKALRRIRTLLERLVDDPEDARTLFSRAELA